MSDRRGRTKETIKSKTKSKQYQSLAILFRSPVGRLTRSNRHTYLTAAVGGLCII